jgi:hypothetical protein
MVMRPSQKSKFKRGLEIIGEQQAHLGNIDECTDEYIAFVLGALARVYGTIDNAEKLWKLRQKIWTIEEKLGEIQQEKLEDKQER